MSALSPSVVAAITDLELAARLVVEGLRAGGHRSPFHGYNAEFQQHRPYRAGDDLKHLDWKILARTDRLYSKQFRETTSMSVMIVLDTSASMSFGAGGISKLRYAAIAAASLAYLISSQGDAVGLMANVGGRAVYLPARGGRLHVRSLIARIDKLTAAGAWEPARTIARGAELLARKGVVLVLSDFYDAEEETRRELRRVMRRGHDVSMLQILTPSEIDPPLDAEVELEDLETGERRIAGSPAALAQYRAEMHAFLERCAASAAQDGVDYAMMRTDTPLETGLRNYLLRRGAHHQSVHGSLRELP
jgi:uncharacterized protein (DUF58 family)